MTIRLDEKDSEFMAVSIEDSELLVTQTIRELLNDSGHDVNADSPLVGTQSTLDSLLLVELCIRLEDAALENGFDFDWASENAMSSNRGMFSSVRSLAAEYSRQSAVAS